MRIIYMGTPPFAVPALRALAAAGHEIVAAYTQPPRAAKRGKSLQKSVVHEAAETLGIPVRHPESLRTAETQAAFEELNADIAVVAAYGLILPPAILSAPRRGCINIHASLLPRWRGAAPIQRAILAGDTVTGVTLMQMEAGLDTGPMLLTRQVEMADKTAGMLTDELAQVGAELAVQALSGAIPTAEIQPEEGVTYARKIEKAEAALDFTRPATQLERAVRAFNPAPGAFFSAAGDRIKVLEAEAADGNGDPGTVLDDGKAIACGEGVLRLRLVQRPGKRPMGMRDFLNGFALPDRIAPCPATD